MRKQPVLAGLAQDSPRWGTPRVSQYAVYIECMVYTVETYGDLRERKDVQGVCVKSQIDEQSERPCG